MNGPLVKRLIGTKLIFSSALILTTIHSPSSKIVWEFRQPPNLNYSQIFLLSLVKQRGKALATSAKGFGIKSKAGKKSSFYRRAVKCWSKQSYKLCPLSQWIGLNFQSVYAKILNHSFENFGRDITGRLEKFSRLCGTSCVWWRAKKVWAFGKLKNSILLSLENRFGD